MTQQKITDDLDALLDVLPLDIRHAVEKANDSDNLLEIILDLGRIPTSRFVDRATSVHSWEAGSGYILSGQGIRLDEKYSASCDRRQK